MKNVMTVAILALLGTSPLALAEEGKAQEKKPDCAFTGKALCLRDASLPEDVVTSGENFDRKLIINRGEMGLLSDKKNRRLVAVGTHLSDASVDLMGPGDGLAHDLRYVIAPRAHFNVNLTGTMLNGADLRGARVDATLVLPPREVDSKQSAEQQARVKSYPELYDIESDKMFDMLRKNLSGAKYDDQTRMNVQVYVFSGPGPFERNAIELDYGMIHVKSVESAAATTATSAGN